MLWVRAMDISRLSKRKTEKKQFLMWKNQGSVGADLDHLDAERAISTDPDDNRKRRTLQLHKQSNSWGFTLQTYGIRHKKTKEIDIMTYVDYVEIHGSADIAGLRKGDVIVSVNGLSVEFATHQELVDRIKSSGEIMRLVVLFEDCCRKVELYDRIIKLKSVLSYKIGELKMLEMQEREVLEGISIAHGFSRLEMIRQSIYSKTSSNSWDDISLISSPQTLRHQPNSWATSYSSDACTPKSSIGEDNSIDEPLDIDDSYIDINYADSDSDSGACIHDNCFETNHSKHRTEENNQSDKEEDDQSDKEEDDQLENRTEVLIHNDGNSEEDIQKFNFKNIINDNRGELHKNNNKDVNYKTQNEVLNQDSPTTGSLELISCQEENGVLIQDIQTTGSLENISGQEDNELSDNNIKFKESELQGNICDKKLIPFLFHSEVYINETDEHTKL